MTDGLVRFESTLLATGMNTTGTEVPAEVLSALDAGKRLAVTVTIGRKSFGTTVGVMAALIFKVVASGGAGVKGTLRVRGAGLNRTVPFKLKRGGIGLVALPLTQPIALTLTTTLTLKPAEHARTDHVTFTPTNSNPTTAPRGCVAR